MADTTATLSRGGSSVDIELIEESGGLNIATDIGKPHLEVQLNGEVNPRFQDRWSGIENINLFGTYTGTDAYTKARLLADFIKSSTGGRTTTLTLPSRLDRLDSPMTVVPAGEQEQALTLTYDPGRRDWVGVDLTLSRVSEIQGDGILAADSPTDSGSGPIQLSDGSRTITIDADVTVERAVGRPNTSLRRAPDEQYPRYTDQRRPSFDRWQIDFQELRWETAQFSDTIIDLKEMFRQKLGTTPLTLDFQGLFGYGAFHVVPQGSQGLRAAERVGQAGVVEIPRVNLRVVS